MATPLINIFGNEIKVTAQPRDIARQYAAFAGANGLTAMHLGSRGYQLIIRGRLRDTTRPLLQAGIDAIEQYLWAGLADYTHAGVTYLYVLFEKFKLIEDSSGKSIHFTSEGWVTCDFICYAKALI